MVPPSEAHERSDEELVRAYREDPRGRAGRAAIETLLGRWHGRVYAWCRVRVRDPQRALELAQDTMLGAIESLERFDGRSKFSSWLYAIARNKCISDFRVKRLLHDPEIDPDELPGVEDPESAWAGREGEERLLRLLGETLEPQEQDALWLRVVEERSVPEITAMLGLTSASGARGLLQTARRKLRAAMERTRERRRP